MVLPIVAALILPLLLLIASPLIVSTSILSRPPKISDEDWIAAVDKGARLFEQMQSGCYPDKVNPITREGLEAIGFRIGDDGQSQWPPVFNDESNFDDKIERMFKWTQNEDAYWTAGLYRDFFIPWIDQTAYYNMYSPRNGIIAAIDTKKAAVETLFWSDAAFAMWEAAAAFGQRDIKDLRYIAHHSISNIFAQAVINRMIGGRPGEVKIFGQHTEAFLALLGTVNGAGSVHLLMQHKRQLGRKTIVEAIVFGRVQRDWHWKGPDVIFELKELPSPEMGDTAATNATSSSELTGLCRSLNSLGLDVLEEI